MLVSICKTRTDACYLFLPATQADTQTGSIAATWSYINTDAKTGYRIGNSLNTATAVTVIITSLGLVVYQMRENKKRAAGGRDYRLQVSSEKVATLGHLHPDFRYIH
jgi:hypothetical protein